VPPRITVNEKTSLRLKPRLLGALMLVV